MQVYLYVGIFDCPCRDNPAQFQHITSHLYAEGDEQKKPCCKVSLFTTRGAHIFPLQAFQLHPHPH